MAFDAYLEVSNVPGEATTAGHEKKIAVDSFSFGAHNSVSAVGTGAGSGVSEVHNFTISKKTDKSSAKLFEGCCLGTHYDNATLTLLKAGGPKPVAYLTLKFDYVYVTDISWSGATGGDDTPQETVSFAFKAVEVTYSTQGSGGATADTIVGKYNLVTRTAE